MSNEDRDVASPQRDTEANSSWISEGKVREFVYFEWTINKFSLVGSSLVNSPSFSSQGNLKWNLFLGPKSQEEERWVCLFLRSQNASKVEAEFTFSILFGDKKEFFPISGKRTRIFQTFPGSNSGFGYSNWIDRSTLLNEYLCDDKLTILCKLSASVVGSVKVPECSALDDYDQLYKTRKFSDINLLVDGQDFPAHKAILSARSPVLNDMLELVVTKNESNQVTIDGIAADVFKKMLRFIYTDRAPKSKKMAESLLVAADRFGLDRLKAICEEVIAKKLSVDNAVDSLILADRHSALQLKALAIDYINAHGKDVIATTEWKTMRKSQPRLIAEAYCAFFNKKPPQS